MTKNLKALSKQLFGAQYEQIFKSLLACFILFLSLYAAEIRLVVAPFILFLTSTVFTAGVMWQALNASHNVEVLQGIFLLPFDNKALTTAYMLALSGYTLITKVALLEAAFFAISKWSGLQIVTALFCVCNACFATAAIYALWVQKKRYPAILWGIGIFCVVFVVRHTIAVLTGAIISLGIAIWYLFSVNPYTFYRTIRSRTIIRRTGAKGSVAIYLLRYLLNNKNYLINTLGLIVVACFLPFLFGQFEGVNVMPLGFAILCLNTPICILLSCDPNLVQAIRVLPGQITYFCSRYCLFIFTVNIVVSCTYLCGWQILYENVTGKDLLISLMFALQSAILSVLLEWWNPIRNWKIESDLWHHPRKYIVPLLMMLIAVFVSTWSLFIWFWLCILVAECIGLTLIARRF